MICYWILKTKILSNAINIHTLNPLHFQIIKDIEYCVLYDTLIPLTMTHMNHFRSVIANIHTLFFQTFPQAYHMPKEKSYDQPQRNPPIKESGDRYPTDRRIMYLFAVNRQLHT